MRAIKQGKKKMKKFKLLLSDEMMKQFKL